MKFNDSLLKALNKEKSLTPPVWLMRQAGRYMPEYMAIRSKVSFLELCKSPDLAAEVTMQPVDVLGVDAAILFSDILIPIEPMGIELDFKPAPFIKNPVRTYQDASLLKVIKPSEDVSFVYKAIDKLTKNLNVPLIGFSGAPFTLACYMVEGEGSKNFSEIKKMMFNDNKTYTVLMTKLTEVVTSYLQKQIDHGCQVVQIFDTWAGILSPGDYAKYAFPWVKQIINDLKGAFSIYFAKESATFLDTIKTLNCDAVGVDWKIDLDKADAILEHRFCIQGNMDPSLLLTNTEAIKENADKILSKAKNLPSHIFNLGHGIVPATPVDNVKTLIKYIKER